MSNQTILDKDYESEDSSPDFEPSEHSDSSDNSYSSNSENSESDEESDSSADEDDQKEQKNKNKDVPEELMIEEEDDMCDFEIPSGISENKTTKTTKTTSKTDNSNEILPLSVRKSFPFCFWYFSSDQKGFEKLKTISQDVIKKLFDVEDVDIYLIQGNKEKDRIRVVCPGVYVTVNNAKDIRSLILRDLGHKVISNIIPALLYEVPSNPTIFMHRIWDMGLGKWESYQTYSCFNHPELKTEKIENLLEEWGKSDKDVTSFTEEYKEYLSLSQGENSLILDNDELVTLGLDDKEISEEIKKEVGDNLDKCIEWFKKYHPDTALRAIKRLGDSVFFLDFTKSKNKCRLCNLVHLSNRQYLTYSNKSKNAFYHCYDNDAEGKKHVISFKKQKKAAGIVSL